MSTDPITGASKCRILFSFIAAFAVVFGFEWAFHGIYMTPDYMATSELWRSTEEMQARFQFSLIGQACKALTYATVFCWVTHITGATLRSGILVGFFVSLLPVGASVAAFSYMPLPLELALKWASGELVLGVLIGIILTFINCKKASAKDE